MKNLIRIALATTALASSTQGAPFLAVGDSAELFLTGTAGIRVDDNIFLGKTEVDDVIFDINPGFDLTFGKDAQVQGSLTTVVAFANYSDNSDLNTTLLASNFVTRFDDGKLKLGFNLGYNELNQNAPDIRGLTRRDIFSTGGNAEIVLTQKTAIGGAASFSHENYKRATYADSDTLTIPVNFYYKVTPKVDFSVGYRFRDYDTTIGADSTDHFFNVGARGEFSPKLTGTFAIGITTRNLSPGGSEDLLGLDSSFAYEVTPKTSLQFGVSNDFGTTPQGQQQKNFSINTAVMTRLTEEWALNGGLSFRATDYGNRTDDYWEFTLGGAYVINANIRLLGSYVYRNYDSNLTPIEFTNNVFSFAANFRY